MNGAESLVHTLLKSGVDTCFTNPGTSEMHFVAALDRIPGMKCVLGLFEGVVTGAADLQQRCCIAGRGWPTVWPICTMRGVQGRRLSILSVIRPLITARSMHL